MSKIFFFGLLLISGINKGDALIDFYHFCGGDLLADTIGGPNAITYPDLDDAFDMCDESPSCIGINGTDETGFVLLSNFINIKLNGGSYTYYLADRSNRLSLSNAPSDLDIKVLFAIYPRYNCPSQWSSIGTICVGKQQITQEICNLYPAYLHATFNLVTNQCEARTKEQILASWT
uniref:Uncharacterized protein n=1 Tax=Panagrolaimus davidi TaxID=227884 RepID=A0A914PWB0_9BILA